jgi:hypothetical protein
MYVGNNFVSNMPTADQDHGLHYSVSTSYAEIIFKNDRLKDGQVNLKCIAL